jgi:ankyrin repeat protein
MQQPSVGINRLLYIERRKKRLLDFSSMVLDIMNRTPLHRESELGRVGVARVLLEHGVYPNARANNATPLHLASGSKYRKGRLDVVRLLLQYSSDIHARDDEGQTPFMRATAEGLDDVMQLLLEHGAEDHRV